MDAWNACIDKVLSCQINKNNAIYKYTVKVIKNDTVVGHIPAKISKFAHFLNEEK